MYPHFFGNSMKIDITADFNKALKTLEPRHVRRATSRAINRTLTSARKQSAPVLHKRFKTALTIGKVRQAMRLLKSKATYLRGSIVIDGKPIPLIQFAARAVAEGVSFNSGAGRKIIKGAFIGKMPGSNKKQVWKRTGRAKVIATKGRYAGKKFKREPIKRLFGPSLPVEFLSDDVQKVIAQEIRKVWPAQFKREYEYALSRVR
jgi:hypothetical protein